ncbi:MAG: hypothetical protein FJ095_09720 [Deltaproteobacteria bacterium]|nr:hypothetical protein [Deltaproteobacteria bacterium]
MWVRSAAIRPVPAHAVLSREALEGVEEWLGDDEATTEARLTEIFEGLEERQPALAERLGTAFSRCRDEVAEALGYFLGLTMFRAFEEVFGERLATATPEALAGAEEALTLDEELRGGDPAEAVDSDDVVAMEQPHVVTYIHEHIDTALELHADSVDVDAVHAMYRVLLVELLALSYAVEAPEGTLALDGGEMLA